jgi:anti-sigma B factor antagonist
MEISGELHNNVYVIHLAGNLSGYAETEQLHTEVKQCLKQMTTNIVIDLKQVKWMGSVGLGVLICCLTSVRDAGGDLRLMGVKDKVQDLLEISKLNGIFQIYTSINDAVDSFK